FAKNVNAPNSTGAYDDHYRRLFGFYEVGMASATDPFDVAGVIYEAVTTQHPRLRYPCSWGGREVITGRKRMSDEDWVALGAITDDDSYHARFEEVFGLDIRPRRDLQD